MLNINIKKIDSEIKDLDTKLIQAEAWKSRRDKLTIARKTLLAALEQVQPILGSIMGGGSNKNSRWKDMDRFPQGFSEFVGDSAVKLINQHDKPVHAKDILQYVNNHFTFGDSIISEKRKYTYINVVLERDKRLKNVGKRNYIFR